MRTKLIDDYKNNEFKFIRIKTGQKKKKKRRDKQELNYSFTNTKRSAQLYLN